LPRSEEEKALPGYRVRVIYEYEVDDFTVPRFHEL
jgi:hypothetical protein